MAKSSFASGFAGFLIGVVVGLGIAAGTAVFILKSPVPFVEKVQKVTADVDPAQILSGSVDPNKRLNETESSGAFDGAVKTVTVKTEPAPVQPATKIAPQQSATTYWVQTGAFKDADAAEGQVASLAMMAIEASSIKAGGVWRVRIGPFADKQAAQEILSQLADSDIKSTVVTQ